MMDKRAYTEAYRLIEVLPEELKKKIPDSLILGIKNNMDNSYEFEIDDENLDDMVLLDDTEKILSVIYTDYLASDEEKKVIKNKEMSILKEKENEKKENYSDSYYNFPKEKNNYENNYVKKSGETEENKNVIKIPKEKWYQKFMKMLKHMLKK